jgi:hypothetical protein
MKRYLILLLPLIVSGCAGPEVMGVSVTDTEGILGILITVIVFGIAWTLKCWIEYLFNLRLEKKKKELE